MTISITVSRAIAPSVIMVSAVMLKVATCYCYDQCCYAECRGAYQLTKPLLAEKTWACTIRFYRFVIYGKWTYFIVNYCLYQCQSFSLAWTSTLAYCRICTLPICNAYVHTHNYILVNV
jgi:hypothetical protein